MDDENDDFTLKTPDVTVPSLDDINLNPGHDFEMDLQLIVSFSLSKASEVSYVFTFGDLTNIFLIFFSSLHRSPCNGKHRAK